MAKQDNQWKSYDGREIEPGQVLVRQLVTREYAREIGADPKSLRTWSTAGVSYLVMKVPVSADMEEICEKAFNAQVNDRLDEQMGPMRRARCMVPQPDGRKVVCTKATCGTTCSACPHRGEYEKEDRSMVSLDALEEEEYLPAEAAPSAEDEAILKIRLEELMIQLEEVNPLYPKVIRMLRQGMQTKEIVEALPMKKSRAYELIRKSQAEAERIWRE